MEGITVEKTMSGLLGILAFIGSKHLALDLSPQAEEIIQSSFLRKLIVFAIAYINTKNIKTSILVVLIYIFLVHWILAEKENLSYLDEII